MRSRGFDLPPYFRARYRGVAPPLVGGEQKGAFFATDKPRRYNKTTMHVDLQNILALAIVAAAAWWIVRKFRKGLRGEDSCHCDQSRRPASSRPKIKPLVPPDQIGLPSSHRDES